jgi:hypothetical protein
MSRLGGANTGKPTVFKVLHHQDIKPKFPGIPGESEKRLKLKAAHEREKWIVAISTAFTQLLERERAELLKRERAERLGGSLLLEYQRAARQLYSSWRVRGPSLSLSLSLCLYLSLTHFLSLTHYSLSVSLSRH